MTKSNSAKVARARKKLSKTPSTIDAPDVSPAPQRIQLATGVLVPETQKPHEIRRACTVATLLQLLSLLASNVNRGN
jgi:hypothetical protein